MVAGRNPGFSEENVHKDGMWDVVRDGQTDDQQRRSYEAHDVAAT
jgi:hypothetical protein